MELQFSLILAFVVVQPGAQGVQGVQVVQGVQSGVQVVQGVQPGFQGVQEVQEVQVVQGVQEIQESQLGVQGVQPGFHVVQPGVQEVQVVQGVQPGVQVVQEIQKVQPGVQVLQPGVQEVQGVQSGVQGVQEVQVVQGVQPRVQGVQSRVQEVQVVQEVQPGIQVVQEVQPGVQVVQEIQKVQPGVQVVQPGVQEVQVVQEVQSGVQGVQGVQPGVQEVQVVQGVHSGVQVVQSGVQVVQEVQLGVQPGVQVVQEVQGVQSGVQGVQPGVQEVQVVQEVQPGAQVVQSGVQVVQEVQPRVQVVQPGVQEVQVVQEVQPGVQVVQEIQKVQPGVQVLQPGIQEVQPGAQVVQGVQEVQEVQEVQVVQEVQPGSQPDATQQNFCPSSSVLKTRSSCHPCSASPLMLCPPGYHRSPGAPAQDCKYSVRTSSRTLWVDGCSFQCYRETPLRGCCPGYWGAQCQACPDEARRPCRGRGVCSDGLGGDGSCNCTDGFAGSACEDCTKDRFGPTCSSECTCVHGLCNSGLNGDGRCTCFSGYKGPRCDQELPACASLGCRQNWGCREEALTGRLVCQCLPGFQQEGAQCIAKDPCLGAGCHAQASCVPVGPGQHLCACHQGYSGDGRVCMPRDPCQDRAGGCPPQTARCIYDGPGKSHCECLPGFQPQPGGGCLLKDACSPGSCHPKANCTTTGPGLVQCSCLQGYVGNGKVCYGNLAERLRELNSDPSGQWRGQLGSAISLFNSVEFPLSNLGPFTVFVPVNKGFRGISVRSLTTDTSKARYLCKLHLVGGVLPSETLRRSHVFYTLTGKSAEVESEEDSQPKIRISGSRRKGSILQSDLVASNGLIHIISRLMEGIAPTVDSKPEENLMKIISDYGKFLTFQSLLQKAGLASLMDAPGPITVLAPTSAAFSTMPEGQLDYLRSPEGHNKLVELLRNHILPSTSLDVFIAVSSTRFSTMANQVLDINQTENGQILVGGAAVLEAAVEAKNGRLYVMDGVLTPPSIEPVMPSRCDTTKTRTIQGECVSCSRVSAASCPSGVPSGTSTSGCLFYTTFRSPPIRIPTRGCSPICNATITTPACCGGFYGPDCSPCPGGFQTPCSGHGQCDEGLAGGGACTCQPNFSGSRCQYCSSPQKYGPNCDRTCPCIHGQCDNRPDSDGRCKPDSCRSGHTGRFCERQTAACGAQVRFCHAHADCDFSQGTPRCVCKPGFQGDGITCVAADPCAPPLRGGCSVNAKCIELGPGKHTCRCLIGWTEMGDECRPINNCQGPRRGGCHPNASCIYVGPGQSDCSCKAGYRGDGLSCEPVNQCVSEAGGCHYLASCRLLSSGWTCVCDPGYVGDGLLCYGSVQEELMTLPNASDFYSWTRESGLSESLWDQNLTLLVPTSAAVSQMSPEDRSFWTRKGNLPALIRNHLVPGILPLTRLREASSLRSLLTTSLPVSSSQEVTSVGGATIITPDLAATNGVIHLIDKVLVPDRKLSDGLLATLALRPEFSLFRSYLLDYNLTGEIEMADGFTVFAPTNAAITEHLRKTDANALDLNTTRYHVVPSELLLKTDLKPGGYKPTLLGSSFQIGIYPRDGKLFVNEALVNSSNILCGGGVIHGLSAVLEIIRNHCDKVTDQKVSGLCVDCLFHQNKICPNDTIPDKSVRMRKCLFSRVFEEKPLLTIGCKTTCINKIIERRCCSGFFGQRCEPCPGLKGRPCFNNGECLDGVVGSGVCRCNKGFNGTACETCQSGKYGVHCDQGRPCFNNGECLDGVDGSGVCRCNKGFNGTACETCQSGKYGVHCDQGRPCFNNGECLDGVDGSGVCRCNKGFNGTACETCQSGKYGVHCDQGRPCFNNGECLDGVDGSGVCRCNKGFNGTACETCQSGKYGVHCDQGQPCFNNGECLDGVDGSGVCRCNKGFNGTACETCQSGKYGVHCDQGRPCFNNGECLDGVDGSGVCRCNKGFNGTACETCQSGKYGVHCDQGRPCFNNGECLDGVDGSGVCRCNKGFNGTACETCQSGKYGVHCDQECDCKNGRCNEGLKGDGTCECDVGWRGVHCDEKIESKADELCGSVKCHSSANCVIRTSGPECLCAAGFKGNGSFCEAVDPCLLDNGGCSQHAVCKRTRPGRRDCVCNRGYAGDGLVCVEINPCLEGNGGCHANADCIHVGPNKTSCSCISGYSGDGQNCSMINLCKKKNGGCHKYAVCNMTGPGQRSCSCSSGLIGDGLTCRGTVEREMRTNGLTQFYFGLRMAEISLKGRGPFTVFAPKQTYEDLSKMKLLSRYQEAYANLLRGHIVMCHTLLPSDLLRPQNLTSLSGTLLTTSYQQGSIRVNAANLTRSDGPSLNGIIHTLDQVLFPPGMDADKILLVPDTRELNLTQLADRHGYKTFSKLLQDSGVMELVSEVLNQPVTVFLPSDVAMATLPQSQRDFLFHPDHRPHLLETLKYHILQGQKVYAEQLVYLDSARTLQGSALSFSCGGADNIGDIFVNEASCRIRERHLVFDGGLAYGIDCLLTPPSLGGRCDSHTTFDLRMDCGHCTSSATRCPKGAKKKEVQKCDLPTMFVSKDSGCRPVCSISVWQPKCCPGYYGRDCLVCPGGVHGPCNNRGKCDDGHFGNGTCTCAPGFGGTACELCSAGFFGPTCKACNCSGHGSCDDGLRGTGCFCEDGWTGDGCDVQTEVFRCSPPCSPKAVCRQNNTCVCRPPYAGDGLTCTVVDMCGAWSGLCDKVATCSQTEEKVSCSCPKGYSGDGFTCVPIDPCVSGDNGGCHEHAICTMTAPGKKTCTCKENFVGDGVTCEAKQLPLSRCLQDNGQCHPDAKCTDLHFEDATLGVFHYRASKGQYKLNYTEAQQTCTEQGGHLATYSQLSYAQQGGLHVCAASWLDQARVAYPTTYSNPKCGFGHVGIVDYGTRKNLSETWDAFCYRMKEVKCECKPGYVGDGLSCAGNLLQVLNSNPTFSNFLTQVLNYSEVSESGRQFVKRLSNLAVQSTLFVPDNSGLPGNQTLTQRDMESHLSEGVALPLSQMKNGSRIRTRAGSLTVLGVADLLNPSALTSCYINERFVIDSDIVASNGIIHVLQGPLEAPPPQHQIQAAHQAGMGVGVVLLVVLVTGAIFVGYHFYKQNTKPFQFHYFKEDDREEEEEVSAQPNVSRSICNPVYEAGPESTRPHTPAATVEDQRGPVGGTRPGPVWD